MSDLPSSLPQTDRQIREDAARWVADADAGLLTPDDEARLSAWLDADPRHRQAYERAHLLWAALGDIEETPGMRPAPEPERRPAPGHRRAPGRWRGMRPSRRPRKVATAVAACAAILAVVLATDVPLRLRADAMTATGQQKLVSLPDGSTVLLNTRTAIAFDYTPAARRIRLLQGEALFSVRADPARPFTVAAHGGETRALGTRFILRGLRDGAAVTVTQHRVRVSLASRHRDVGEGQGLTYDARHGLSDAVPVDLADADAWTRGRLVAVNRPLGDVVADIGRYHGGYIHVAPDIAAIPVSGNFRTADPMAALDQIQAALGLSSTRISNYLIYLHK